GAGAGFLGALSTSFFPYGIEQDLGDLALQPLLVGFSLYHAAALALAFALSNTNVSLDYPLALALLAPAITSAALGFGAPYIDATLGGVLMIAAGMGWGAALSTMIIASFAMRAPGGVAPELWILGTSLAMDAALGLGV